MKRYGNQEIVVSKIQVLRDASLQQEFKNIRHSEFPAILELVDDGCQTAFIFSQRAHLGEAGFLTQTVPAEMVPLVFRKKRPPATGTPRVTDEGNGINAGFADQSFRPVPLLTAADKAGGRKKQVQHQRNQP
jgi:hypothetical protein